MFNSMIIVGAAASAVLMISDIHAGGKWERHGNENGVVVYTSRFPSSEVPEVKAVAVVNAPTSKVWEYITQSMRIDGLKVRRTLGTCGEGCDYVFVRLGNWAITDRHYVIKVRWNINDVGGHPEYIRSWRQTQEKGAMSSDSIQVHSIHGSWTLTPIDNGKRTRITYINHLDLGGNVPPALFSRGFVNKAYDILKNVKDNA